MALVLMILSGCAGGSYEGKNGETLDISGIYKKEKWDETRDLDKPNK